jgi:hypothetical protein
MGTVLSACVAGKSYKIFLIKEPTMSTLSPTASRPATPMVASQDTPVNSSKYKALSITNDYLNSITASDCSLSSVAAKVSLVVFPVVVLLTLLADLAAALVNCLFGEKDVKALPTGPGQTAQTDAPEEFATQSEATKLGKLTDANLKTPEVTGQNLRTVFGAPENDLDVGGYTPLRASAFGESTYTSRSSPLAARALPPASTVRFAAQSPLATSFQVVAEQPMMSMRSVSSVGGATPFTPADGAATPVGDATFGAGLATARISGLAAQVLHTAPDAKAARSEQRRLSEARDDIAAGGVDVASLADTLASKLNAPAQAEADRVAEAEAAVLPGTVSTVKQALEAEALTKSTTQQVANPGAEIPKGTVLMGKVDAQMAAFSNSFPLSGKAEAAEAKRVAKAQSTIASGTVDGKTVELKSAATAIDVNALLAGGSRALEAASSVPAGKVAQTPASLARAGIASGRKAAQAGKKQQAAAAAVIPDATVPRLASQAEYADELADSATAQAAAEAEAKRLAEVNAETEGVSVDDAVVQAENLA